MVRLIDPPRLTENQVDVPENVSELLRSAQRDTPTLSEIASLKQRLAPLLNTPAAPGGFIGPLNGSFAGLGKIVAVTTLVAASGLTYWALQDRTTNVETPSSAIDGQPIGPQPIDTQEQRDVDLAVPSTPMVSESTKSASDLHPNPVRSTSRAKREVARNVHAKPALKGGVDTQAIPTAEPQALIDPSTDTQNARNEMDEAELLSLARNALPDDPSRTLRLTFEHYRKFGTGALGEEREVLIIEALVRLGRKDEAQARTRNFLSVYPQSVYRRRLSRQVFTNQ